MHRNSFSLCLDSDNLAIDSLLAKFPASTISLALAAGRIGAWIPSLIGRSQPISTSPGPITHDPHFSRVLWNSHGHIASSAIASCPRRGTPGRVGPDAQFKAGFDQLMRGLTVTFFASEAAGQIWPSPMVPTSVGVQTFQGQMLIAKRTRSSGSLLCQSVHL